MRGAGEVSLFRSPLKGQKQMTVTVERRWTVQGVRQRLWRMTWHDQRIDWSGYILLAPFITLFVLFNAIALLFGIYLSFNEWKIVGNPEWIGLANFQEILKDDFAVGAFVNTFRYAMVITPGVTIVAFILALFVHQQWPAHILARAAFFSPFICAPTAVGLIWVWLLDTRFGLINHYLGRIGIPPVPWLTSTDWSWLGVSLMSIWWDAGFSFILFLAALQDVPVELKEAAQVDGANRLQVIWYIVLPLLRPVTSMIITLQMIGTLRIFSQINVMTQGGPAGSSRSVIQYLYAYGLSRYRFGYASAVAVLLLIVTLLVTFVGRRIVKEEI